MIRYKVYDGTKLNSQLDWDASYLFKTGARFQFNYKNLILNTSNLFALPFECGYMYDSDWYTEGIKTNYAKRTLSTDLYYDLNIELKYKFIFNHNFSIIPIISYNFCYISFRSAGTIAYCGDSAHTGLFDDYPWDSEYAVQVEQYGIDVLNKISIFYLGSDLEKNIDNFTFGLKMLVSPFIYISSLDHHLNASGGRYYLLIHRALFYSFNMNLSCSYMINKKNELILSTNFSYLPDITGYFYMGKEKNADNLASGTKFSFTKFSVNLGWRIVLF
ncbi:MAG: omptin family outer membrane protease [Treponema sp.]|nr:omptin family outer membrane protease [Treponema sp.]